MHFVCNRYAMPLRQRIGMTGQTFAKFLVDCRADQRIRRAQQKGNCLFGTRWFLYRNRMILLMAGAAQELGG
jgi:hypothetical protein